MPRNKGKWKTNLHLNKHNYTRQHKKTKKHTDDMQYRVFRVINLEQLKREQVDMLDYNFRLNNEKVALSGYLTLELLKRNQYNWYVYLIIKQNGNGYGHVNEHSKNDMVGICIFRNLTDELKKDILGRKQIEELKSRVDIQIYQIHYCCFNGMTMNKKMMDMLVNRFRRDIGINRNMVITLLRPLNVNVENFDMVSRYLPIINYRKNEAQQIEKLGFTYTGYQLTNHNEILNTFAMRFLDENISSKDFWPIYSLTRQFVSEGSININKLISIVNSYNLYSVESIYKYSVENTFLYYIKNDENLYTLNASVPFYNNFIFNYMSNRLGNSHLVCNYPYLYDLVKEYYGSKSKELNCFIKLLDNMKDIVDFLNLENKKEIKNKEDDTKDEKYIIIRTFNINTQNNYKAFYVFNTDELNLIMKHQNKYGYYAKMWDSSVRDHLKIKNDELYWIAPYVLITKTGNDKYNSYVYDKSLIFKYNLTWDERINKGKSGYSADMHNLIFPNDYNDLLENPIENTELDFIQEEIRKIVKIIAIVYKKHACLKINQINGFILFNLIIYINRDNNGKIYLRVSDVDDTIYFPEYNNYKTEFMTDRFWTWVNELAIKPNFPDNDNNDFESKMEEIHYQSVI